MSELLEEARGKYDTGDLEGALRGLYRLLETDRSDPDAFILAATIHEERGDHAAAATFFVGAIDISPNLKREVAFRAASHYLAVKDSDSALSALLMLARHMPGDRDVNHSICSLHREAGRYHDALPFARKLATIGEEFGNFLNAGIVLSGLGLYEEAFAPLVQAFSLNPQERLAHSELLWCARNLANLELADGLQAELEAAYRREGENADIRENAFRAIILSGDEFYHARCAQRTGDELFPPVAARPAPRASGGRIRVGYVSGDFHDHATMALFAGVLEAHDREAFEIYGICHTAEAYRTGQMRERFLESVDFYIDILELDDDAAADLIRSLELDILVDLKGFTQGNRLGIFCRRPAPAQVAYLGFPGSVIGAGMDYAITDPIVTPETSARFYQEKLLPLTHSYQCNDRARAVFARTGDRAALGLPADAVVFCSFNQPQKITLPVFSAWMQILGGVEGSVLWLLAASPSVTENLRAAARNAGIDPQRLVFAANVPMEDHLRRLAEADIALDTNPCNGHTTTVDALWSAVPVVTFRGTSFAGRVSESLLSAVGLNELVAKDIQQFVRLAVELAQDGARQSRLRHQLIEARTTAPLFDTVGTTRAIEQKFTEIARPAAAE